MVGNKKMQSNTEERSGMALCCIVFLRGTNKIVSLRRYIAWAPMVSILHSSQKQFLDDSVFG